MKNIAGKPDKYLFLGAGIILLAVINLTSCGPNEKLKIDGKKYTISLGEIDYDTEDGVVTVQVLADGKPLHNAVTQTQSSVNVGGQLVSASVSSSRPVNIQLQVNGKFTFPRDQLSSNEYFSMPMVDEEWGLFVYSLEAAPEKIAVYTGTNIGSNVYFDAKTKKVISYKEYYPSVK